MTKNKASPPQKPAPQMSAEMAEQQQQLADKLREIFQLERGDLDFGIYRILACKKDRINDFLEKDLPRLAQEAMAESGQENIAYLQKELDKTKDQAKEIGAKPEDSEKYVALQKLLTEAKQEAKNRLQDCADVFQHLCAFFARYYNNGDFMPIRRYKAEGKEAYLLPYNGEEVKLHWANADQYYIKTAQNFSSYQFLLEGGARVRFEVTKADAEKENIKGASRRFLLAAKTPATTGEGGELVIRFNHIPHKDKNKKQNGKNGNGINAETENALLQKHLPKLGGNWAKALAAPAFDAEDAPTVLGRHIARFTAKNEFDYFIHKNLGGFLRRELDVFIKTEVLQLADLHSASPKDFERVKAKMRAIDTLGEKLIALLEQTEEFQKKLWLKKKFVLQTNYCLTVDKIPEKLRGRAVANKAQVEEWRRLFAIDDLPGGKKPTAAFLAQNPHLVVDTRHFDSAFVDELLAALGDKAPLCDQFNGLLVHGENFAALNLLQAQYGGRVQTVYIDPPYNTLKDNFPYKDGLPHSSWLTMMSNRYEAAKPLLSRSGVVFTSIGEEENSLLDCLLQTVFGSENKIAVATREMKKGANRGNHFSPSIDYVSCYGIDIASVPNFNARLTKKYIASFRLNDKDGKGPYKLTNLYEPSLDYFENCRYPIVCPDGEKVITPPEKSFTHNKESYETMLKNNGIVMRKGNSSLLETTDGRPTKWKVYRKIYLAEIKAKGVRPQDLILDIINSDGTKELTKMGLKMPFSKPKGLVMFLAHLLGGKNQSVVDFFAGSGTTGHAVIDLNREDKGNRKYILVEMGNHFESVLLPRMKKAIYSKEWLDRKPVEEKLDASEKKERGIRGEVGLQGVSQMFRYVRLESYDDSMDNLQVRQSGKTQKLLDEAGNKMAESYLLRYALNAETGDDPALAGGDFSQPDEYNLCVTEKGARAIAPVDLAETFNFLLGLQVATRRRVDGVLAITGTTAKGESCLVLWRKIDEDETKAAAKLDKWFAANRDKLGANFADLNKIYVNGAHTLNAMRKSQEGWQAESIEAEFRAQMFQKSGS